MYRVYNNQPYECYRETVAIFDTDEEAMLFIYIHNYYENYYYENGEDLWLSHGEVCNIMKENKFTIEDAIKARDENRSSFFDKYNFECLNNYRW